VDKFRTLYLKEEVYMEETWGQTRAHSRSWVLDEARNAVLGTRQDAHGNPEDTFDLIAKYWAVHLDTVITPGDVAIMMTLLKLARLRGNPDHMDSAVDAVGYMACFAETRKPVRIDIAWESGEQDVDQGDPDTRVASYIKD
jgi:hypothetical protein